MTRPSSRVLFLLSFAAIYVIWGSTYLAIRVAIDSLPPFSMAGIRFLLAGIPLYLILRWRGEQRPSLPQWRFAGFIGALMMFGGNGLVSWSQQFVVSSVTAVLIASVPLWIVLLDVLFYRGTKPSGWVAVALLLGIAGIIVLIAPSSDDFGSIHLGGAAVLLLASLSWAFGSLETRKARIGGSALMFVALQTITGGAILLLAATATGEWARLDVAAITWESVLALVYLSVFGTIVALCAYTYLLRTTSATAVSTYAFVNPVIAVILGWAVLGEKIGPQSMAGALLIVGAVVLLHWSRVRQHHPKEIIAVKVAAAPRPCAENR